MKRNIFIINLLLVLFLVTGCEDFLKDEPESVLTSVDFYTTPERIEGGILGCYFGMKAVIDEEWIYTELRSDNTCVAQVNSGSTERTYHASCQDFSISASEGDLRLYWYYTFQNIKNINLILPSVIDNTYIVSEELRAQYEAELRFMRAHHYFTLVTLFGDMFKLTSVIGPDESLGISRSPVSEIYNEIIIPDLRIAAEGAPYAYESADVGRVTEWAAKGLLAKAYIQMGGSENLAQAKALLEEFVIEGRSPHGLLSNVASIFDVSNEMNREIIFAIRYKRVDGNGSPFFYEFAAIDGDYFPLGNSGGQGNNNPTFELIEQYASDTADSRNDLVGVFEASRDYPYHLKYQDWAITDRFYGENDWIVLRYADIVLLYAEILAQDGNHASAHTYVNMIRNRAGEGIEEAAPFASKEEALDAVYQERKLELAFENHRWFDLLRMNSSYNNPNKAMDILREHTFDTDWRDLYRNYQKIDVPVESNYINERLLLPIPQDELDANPGVIYQNPSY